MSTQENASRFEFKAWDKIQEQMLNPEDFVLKYVEEIGFLPHNLEGKCLVTKKDPHTIELLQYSGRKDRIGQKVYEGHLLKDNSGDLYRVFFDREHGSFRLKSIEAKKAPSLEWPPTSKLVIVGTIYEGGYLLEES